jgi:hypothetical protein
MWIQNRNSFTSLAQFGLRDVGLVPNGIRRMIKTPALQEAIKAEYVVEVEPIWNEQRTDFSSFRRKE